MKPLSSKSIKFYKIIPRSSSALGKYQSSMSSFTSTSVIWFILVKIRLTTLMYRDGSIEFIKLEKFGSSLINGFLWQNK